ncbi:MAG: hypothetical protein ACRCYU_11355 [Nocardioides sp.]
MKTAEEFIRLWDRVGTDVINTGDTEVYRAITEGCQSCRLFDEEHREDLRQRRVCANQVRANRFRQESGHRGRQPGVRNVANR